jgi:capsular polysaccharide transport system permease protein
MQYVNDSTLGSLRIQIRVVGALFAREIITRFGRHNVGFLWLFLEPILFTLGVIVLWTATRDVHGFKVQIAPFVVTGYSTLLMWRNCSYRGLKAIEPNRSLMYHRNVRVVDIFTARMLLEVVAVTASFIFVMLVLYCMEQIKLPSDVALMLVGWFLLSWFSVNLGVILGCLSEYTDIVERLWHPISYFLLPISGAFFMVDWLPSSAHDLAQYVPMLNASEMVRGGYFGSSITVHYSVSTGIVMCSCFTLLSFILLARVRRMLEARG